VKILYVSPYPPAPDGIGTYTRAFAGAAQGQGHDVRVLVPRMTEGSPAEVLGALPRGGRERAATSAAVAAWQPDVVHVQFAVAAFGTAMIALMRWLAALRRAMPVTVVVTMHEVTRETGLLGPAGRAIYRRIAGLCDQIIVHTAGAATALTGPIGVPGAKVTVIAHPSAPPPAAGATPGDLRDRCGLGSARILLAFGFIHVDKGLGDLVQALGIVKDSGAVQLEDIRLVVAGAVRRRSGMFRVFEAWDRIHLARVLRRARRLSLSRQLVLTGYVPDRDVAAWFQAADAVVLPYRHAEQSGVAGLAGAFGTPVLASTAGGLGEQFGGSPWSFPPRSPEHLARVLAGFLAGPAGPQAAGQRPASQHGQPATDLATIAAVTFGLYRDRMHAPAGSQSHAA